MSCIYYTYKVTNTVDIEIKFGFIVAFKTYFLFQNTLSLMHHYNQKDRRHSITLKAVTVKTMNETCKQKYNINTQIDPTQQRYSALKKNQYKIIST